MKLSVVIFSVGDIEFKVTKMINSGYQLLGGVSFNQGEYLQAMVKYDNEPCEKLNFPDARKPRLT